MGFEKDYLTEALTLPEAEMKRLGYQVVDSLVDHFLSLESKPVSVVASPEDLAAIFDGKIPEGPEPVDYVLDQVITNVFGNMMHTTHPRFMAYVPSPSNYVAVLADALVAGFNPFAGTWMEASGPTHVELVTLGWLRQLMGMPDEAGGLFVSGGSVANLIGLAVARQMKLGERFQKGVVYYSDQTHSAVTRGLRILGFSDAQIRILPSDDSYRLPVPELRRAILVDRKAGRTPFCVVANAGTTNTGTVDPLDEISGLCKREDMWVHVDAAYGGACALTAEGRSLLTGISAVDSIVIDPHKWLFQPYEIGCVLVKDRRWMRETFQILPEYLQDIESRVGEVNLCDYGVQLTRSFRALKLWMSLKVFGLEAFREAVAWGFELAERAQLIIQNSTNLRLISPAQMGVITFRFEPPDLDKAAVDILNLGIVEDLIADRIAFLSSTQLKGRTVLRLCTINPRTRVQDLQETLERVEFYGALRLKVGRA